MIHKFPKLTKTDKSKLVDWLKKEKHRLLAEQYSYLSCGNEDEAAKHYYYASEIESILIMIEYHEEEK